MKVTELNSLRHLTRKQEQAIVALLEHGTVQAAAEACGLTRGTLWRYLQDEAFSTAYRAARREVVGGAINRLQSLMNRAVETLERNLDCKDASVEVRAAHLVLEHALKGGELAEMQQRLEQIEKMLEEQEKRRVA